MNELVKKLMEAGKQEALNSEETLRAAAKELGASDAEIDACIEELGGFPLDDSALEQVGGGVWLNFDLACASKPIELVKGQPRGRTKGEMIKWTT